MNRIIQMIVSLVVAVGVLLGRQTFPAAEGLSSLLEGVGAKTVVAAKLEGNIAPRGLPIGAASFGSTAPMPYKYVSFEVGSGVSYTRHMLVWEKQDGVWKGWYAIVECNRVMVVSDCNTTSMPIEQVIEAHKNDGTGDSFWGATFTLDLLPGPSHVAWYPNELTDHTVTVNGNHIIQTVHRFSGTYTRTVPTSGKTVLWSNANPWQ